MNKAYSEYQEDAWIMQNIQLPEKGFYVDIGCAWPCLYSNTAFLRDRGWQGINIDGNASYTPNWEGVAPFLNCVVGNGKPVHFERNGVPELSRVTEGSADTPTRPLWEILWEVPHVDFLSCDLEGHEFAALQTLDWQKHKPAVVVAEYNTHGIGEDYRVKEMLEAMGYQVRHKTVANLIYTL